MRMWMVAPKLMCDKHLLGEHVELHMFVGSINKGISMAGYIANNLMEPKAIRARHDAIVEEMEARGMKHKSPLAGIAWHRFTPAELIHAEVETGSAYQDLLTRCPDCLRRFSHV